MFNEDQRLTLGLSKAENKILNFVKNEALSISEIARQTRISRTSLYSMLQALQTRGLVRRAGKGKRHFWQLVSLPLIHERFFNILDELNVKPSEKQVSIISSQDSQYKIYRGKENVVQIYEELGKLPRFSRLYGIQPNVSAYSVMKQFPFDRLVTLNQDIKKRKIIVEAILQENFLSYYISQLRKEKKPVKDIFKAYGGRLADTTYVPKEYLNFDSELFFYRDVVVILNWQELIAVVIKNKEIFGIMRELFNVVKNYGKKVDQNPQVIKILDRFNDN
jgi:DNA-binding HxlR family transcriptional regulator